MKPIHAHSLLAASLLPLSTLWLSAADTTTTTTSTTTQPTSAAQGVQMEAVQRQQLIFSASQAVSDGQRLLGSAQYDAAAARFQYAVDSLSPGGGAAASLYNRAAAGLAAAKSGQAGVLAKDAKFAQAATKLREAIDLQPNNTTYPAQLEELKKMQQVYEQQVHDPEGTVHNPAVTDEFKDKVATVQKLLFQGDAYFATGQYDRAEATYTKILIIDPYNNAARNKMDHVEKYKMRAAGFRHEEYEQEQMLHVNQDWTQAISPDIVEAPKINDQANPTSERAKITRKLQSIIIDKVNFDKLDINTVIQFLQDKSKELDPEHEGINFVLRLSLNTPATDPGAATPTGATPGTPAPAPVNTSAIHREVSITLDNVPLAELLRYIADQTNLQFTVEDYAVYLRPSIDEGETLTVRTFLVPPNFFNGSALRVSVASPTDYTQTTISSVTVNVQQDLTSKGISFPAGATATFLPGSSKLVVRNTTQQLDQIANLIETLSKETPQIQIETKLAEFNEDAIKSLSFNYVVGPGVGSGFESFGAATALRNAYYPSQSPLLGGLTPNSLDVLIAQNAAATNPFPITNQAVAPNVPNVLQVGAIIDGTGLAMIVEAINNLKGASLLSAPSVTTQNGLKANIDIVQEFPYPTSFEKPKLSTTQVAYSSPVAAQTQYLQLALPPTPREFVTQDVGVSLEVKPTTYPDKRIDLDITKAQVIDFDGFINYGVPITAKTTEAGPIQILTPGTINQPVFNLRSVVTNLQVLDGQTAVLGGLLLENTQEINDKVPGLGDLPLVGRMFQSKVSERTKKNLVIFVTARLIRSNGKPQYVKTLEAEPEEEKLPEPEQQIGPGVTLPPLPEGGPNS